MLYFFKWGILIFTFRFFSNDPPCRPSFVILIFFRWFYQFSLINFVLKNLQQEFDLSIRTILTHFMNKIFPFYLRFLIYVLSSKFWTFPKNKFNMFNKKFSLIEHCYVAPLLISKPFLTWSFWSIASVVPVY